MPASSKVGVVGQLEVERCGDGFTLGVLGRGVILLQARQHHILVAVRP